MYFYIYIIYKYIIFCFYILLFIHKKRKKKNRIGTIKIIERYLLYFCFIILNTINICLTYKLFRSLIQIVISITYLC